MQKGIDWLDLWRELVETQEKSWGEGNAKGREDMWLTRAAKFDMEVKRRWAHPDSSRTFVTSQLQAHPEWTALDIGAGTGSWTALMAAHARAVTAVEPSPAMLAVIRRNVAEARARNITIMEEKWPEAQPGPHDLTLCSHSIYGFADFAALIRSIEATTRHMCVLILRAPIPEDPIGIAALRTSGQPFDSPNFQVAYNALLQMGIFPNVIMEDTGLWDPWISNNMEDALAEAKRKLNLPGVSTHDSFLRTLLEERLTPQDGRLAWPRSIRTALVYWTVQQGV